MDNQAFHNEGLNSARIDSVKAEVLKTVAYTLLRQAYGVSEPEKFDIRQGVDFYEAVSQFEVNLIKQALLYTSGKQRAAASLLKLNATTLHAKIKFYGIDLPKLVEYRGLPPDKSLP